MNLSCKTILAAGFVANMAKLIYARTNYVIASHVKAKTVTDGWVHLCDTHKDCSYVETLLPPCLEYVAVIRANR